MCLMGFDCYVVADSVAHGVRLTTVVVTGPRIVLAEFNTHRALSRNSNSSRAIPVSERIAAVESAPFVPAAFGRNRRGMQAGQELDEASSRLAREAWSDAAYSAVAAARRLADLEVHKQFANRVLEPYSWHTIVSSATDWANFFALRCHEAAQPEIRVMAEMMRDALSESTPTPTPVGGWHLPLLTDEERASVSPETIERLKLVSVGRCTRVSYDRHERREPDRDVEIAQKLLAARPIHASPLEHVATPDHDRDRKVALRDEVVARWGRHERWMDNVLYVGNFEAWVQMRHMTPGESVRG